MVRYDGILLIIVGVVALSSTFVIYDRFNDVVLDEDAIKVLDRLSILVYLMMLVSLPIISLGLYRMLKGVKNTIINSILSILSERRYLTIFIISFIVYGIIYAFIANILVYKPELNNSYNVKMLSYKIVPCCGPIGYMPMLIIYINEAFGIIIIPLNLILLLVVSALVSINITIFAYIYRNKPKSDAKWLFSLGAMAGLFTGCPTCAGTFFILLFGLSSISIATLAPLQSLFIAISIPVLLITPILMIKRFYACRIK